MGEETTGYDPLADGVDDDTTSQRPVIAMSDLPDLRTTFDPDAPLTDSGNLSRDEFTTVYDIIDKLESALDEAKPILFSPGTVRVDRDEFTEQLDQLKRMMPVQLERASALMRESERRLESAQTQANVIVSSAQSRASPTLYVRPTNRRSLRRSENVTEIARQKARAISTRLRLGRPSHAGSRQVLHHGDGNAATAARQAWQRRAGGIERTV